LARLYLHLRQTAVVKQAIDTARASVPLGGNSASYLCQQEGVFAAQDRLVVRSTAERRLSAIEALARKPP